MPAVWEELAELREAIARVRELHKKIKTQWIDGYVCSVCAEYTKGYEEWVKYPCPTIQALDGEQ